MERITDKIIKLIPYKFKDKPILYENSVNLRLSIVTGSYFTI
jgi:hypothetical protein|tara:strand:+ start:249 stop:374 length:126 start_codon:yes stop_codon:yes gene_type:complete